MDGQRFDEWTKALTTGTSRRRVLRGLGGAFAGGVLGAVGVKRVRVQAQEDDDLDGGDGDAGGTGVTIEVSAGGDDNSVSVSSTDVSGGEGGDGGDGGDVVVSDGGDDDDDDDGGEPFCGEICIGTPEGLPVCCPGAGCTLLQSDPFNCGKCGNECQQDAGCVNGVCTPGIFDCPVDFVCGADCCAGPGEVCVDDICVCARSCQTCGDVCCCGLEACLGKSCCLITQICDGVCCPDGSECVDGGCSSPPCAVPCGDFCCPDGTSCVGNACADPGCAVPCGNICCDLDDLCRGGECIPTA